MLRERTKALNADDLVLTVLCTATGPSLWWAGTTLVATADASGTAAQLEMWLAVGLATTGLLIAAWWLVALLGAVLTAWGARVRSARMLSWGRRLSPEFLRRVAVITLGVQTVTAGGAWAAPAPTADTSGQAAGQVVSSRSLDVPSPGWTDLPTPQWSKQMGHVASTVSAQRASAQEPTPSPAHEEVPSPGWSPRLPAPPAPGSATRPSNDARMVTVRSGDCLWDIAAQELGPYATDLEIDRRWRDWYRTNAKVIGPNPHHLVPGTVLNSPAWT